MDPFPGTLLLVMLALLLLVVVLDREGGRHRDD